MSSFIVGDNPRQMQDDLVWEMAAANLLGIGTYGAFWRSDAEEGIDPNDRPFNPALADPAQQENDDINNEPIDPIDRGGRQPGVEFSLPSGSAQSKEPWYEISLFNPFKLAFHGLKIPVLGYMSLIVERTKSVGIVVYSLMYMALPTLAWFLGIDKSLFGSRKYTSWRLVLDGEESTSRCPTCSWWMPVDFMDDNDFKRNPFLGCMCQLSRHPLWLDPMSDAAQDLAYYNNAITHTSFSSVAIAIEAQLDCSHHDAGEMTSSVPHTPRPTLDGLYMHGPEEEWKSQQRCGGLRCTLDYSQNMHGWHPAALAAAVTRPKKFPKGFLVSSMVNLQRWAAFVQQFDRGESIFLVAVTLNRLEFFRAPPGLAIIIYQEPEVRVALEAKYPDAPTRYFRVPKMGFSGRYLAAYRIILASVNPAPISLIIVNQQINNREAAYIEMMKSSPYAWISGTGGYYWPFYAGAAIVKGRTMASSITPLLASFYHTGAIYGWDEIWPAYREKVVAVCFRNLTSPGLMIGTTTPKMRGPEVAMLITDDYTYPSVLPVTHWSRQAVYWVQRAAGVDVDPGRLTFFHVWSDPRPTFRIAAKQFTSRETHQRDWYTRVAAHEVPPQPRRVIAPGDHVLQELAASNGGIHFFTIGTRGDIQPFEALARHVASYGVQVTLHVLNDEDEGKELLGGSLGLHDSDRPIQIFNRARSRALCGLTGSSVVHAALMIGNAPSLELAPPNDLIFPRTVGGTWLMTMGSALMGVWFEHSARIGPYTGPRVVPISSDGETFLKPVQNRRKFKIGAVWGSDGVPAPGYEDIPLVPDGNHAALFPDYITIVCHGGTGTVSLAAACGCKVIVPVGGLDRSRRNMYDAGLGLVPGADPDNIFLVLADSDIRYLAFWLRANWLKPWKLWMFYGYPTLGWVAFRVTMLYFLYTRSFRRAPISSDPWIVLARVLGLKQPTFLVYSMLLFAAKMLDHLLDYLNIAKLRILTEFARYNWAMAISPIAMFLASEKNIAVGLLYAVLSPVVYDKTTHIMQSIMNVLLGTAPMISESGDPTAAVYLEYSPRIWNCFPVLHTALVCPEKHERFEGVDKAGVYVMDVHPGGLSSPIIIPTMLTWDEVKSIPHYSGRYSLAWNCQTAIVLAFRDKLVTVGPGVIIPYLGTLGVSLLYTATAICTTALWGLTSLIPTTITPKVQKPSEIAIAGTIVTNLWNQLSLTGHWDPIVVVEWWRSLYMPV